MRSATISINFPVKKDDIRRAPAPLITSIEFDTVENLRLKMIEAINSYHWENMSVKVSNLEIFSKEEINYLEQYMLN